MSLRRSPHPHIKHNTDDDEEPEKQQLHEQSKQHDLLSHIRHASLRHHASTTSLHEESNDIAADKYLGNPRRSDD